jgi:molybdopterin-guanine dinucleotide biosynthesis protein A
VSNRARPVGAVLAGGAGRRLGGAKATVRLNRRPLISYPLEAVWRGLGNAVVVAKMGTELPPLPGTSVWIEPEEPRHPLAGLVHALRMAGDRSVLVCAGDLPLITPKLIAELALAEAGGALAVVACAGEQLQPLLGCYRQEALPRLVAALGRPDVRLTEVVAGLEPELYEVPDPLLLFNVNTPEDLLQAGALLTARRGRRGRPAGINRM